MTNRLLRRSAEIWESFHSHPFVRGIADGTLDQEKFRFYMIQDYLYLIDYARVFALGAAKARDLESMRLFAGYVHQILDGEMEIHKSYMRRLGITDAEEAEADLTTVSYTSYMLRLAYEGSPAEIAASILACALSYEHIAKRIVAEHPDAPRHPFYGEWVEGYANEEYSKANRELIALTDRLAEDCSEAERQRLEEIFLLCSRYEAAFWDMAWNHSHAGV